MSVILRQVRSTRQRIDFSGILPGRLAAMNPDDIRRIPLHLGNHPLPLAELFEVEIQDGPSDELLLLPVDGGLDQIGTGLENGRIIVDGDAGHYTGRAMRGGIIEIRGNAGDSTGSGMHGGRLSIDGNVGARTGAPAAGERRGQQGGLIHIRGNAGERAGERMRRGLMVIDGDCGDLLGHCMIAGTLCARGRVGELAGHGMRRGTLLLNRLPPALGSTIVDNGRQQLPFLRLLLNDIQRRTGGPVIAADDRATVQRYVGDLACDGRGEILVLD